MLNADVNRTVFLSLNKNANVIACLQLDVLFIDTRCKVLNSQLPVSYIK